MVGELAGHRCHQNNIAGDHHFSRIAVDPYRMRIGKCGLADIPADAVKVGGREGRRPSQYLLFVLYQAGNRLIEYESNEFGEDSPPRTFPSKTLTQP
jgi:hypothetical protein